MSFWQKTNQPFFILAPMEDVTDTSFREVVMSVSDPNILNTLFTEFTSIDGLLSAKGFEQVSKRLKVNATEKDQLIKKNTKLVVQIWGNNPEKFFKVAQMLTQMELFDGIDINMGCPVKNVVKKNTCSALIQFPELATEIIKATQEGTSLPVSIKTRIGFKSVVTESWINTILEAKPEALTIHGRIQKQMSEGLADWDEIGKAVAMRNSISPTTKIIGNGDIETVVQGREKIEQYALDGVMVGRGIFKNPWMFNDSEKQINTEDRKKLLIFHTKLFEQTWGNQRNFNELKRFYKIYINSFLGAGTLRAQLMECKNFDEVYATIS